MIMIIPIICSNDVDKAIQPGIAKALEKFYLVECMDILTTQVAEVMKGGSKQLSSGGSVSSSSFRMENFDSFGIEATYANLNINNINIVVGIKCIFFPVDSKDPFIELLLSDIHSSDLRNALVSRVRAAKRFFIRVFDKIPILNKFISRGGSIEGKVYKDVILEKSIYEDEVWVCFNSTEIEKSGIEQKGKVPGKLFKLGWKSIIICDDISSTASFCLQQNRGICYKVPYTYLFAGERDKYKLYTDVKDLKQKSSPFFSRRKHINKIFSECQPSTTITNYLQELEETDKNGKFKSKSR